MLWEQWKAVGFFTTGNKIVGLVMTIITAVTSTIIPRMSYLVGSGKEEEAVLLQKKTINLLNYIVVTYDSRFSNFGKTDYIGI
mgnify:CR=1 FL=1